MASTGLPNPVGSTASKPGTGRSRPTPAGRSGKWTSVTDNWARRGRCIGGLPPVDWSRDPDGVHVSLKPTMLFTLGFLTPWSAHGSKLDPHGRETGLGRTTPARPDARGTRQGPGGRIASFAFWGAHAQGWRKNTGSKNQNINENARVARTTLPWHTTTQPCAISAPPAFHACPPHLFLTTADPDTGFIAWATTAEERSRYAGGGSGDFFWVPCRSEPMAPACLWPLPGRWCRRGCHC